MAKAGDVAGMIAGAVGELVKFGEAARSLQAPMTALNATLGAVTGQIAGLVGKLNPIYVQKFNVAVDDLQATIGRLLIPTLQAATAAVREIGSTFNGLGAGGQALVRGLAGGAAALAAFGAAAAAAVTVATVGIGPTLAAVGAAVAGAVASTAELRPVMRELSGILGGVMEAAGKALLSLAPAVGPLVDSLKGLAGWLGSVAVLGVGLLTSLAPLAGSLFRVLGSVLGVLRPVADLAVGSAVSVLAFAFDKLGGAVAYCLDGVAYAVEGFAKLTAWLVAKAREWLSYLGVDIPELGGGASPFRSGSDNTGTAYRNTSFTTQDDAIRKAYAAAYSVGAGGTAQDRTAKASEGTLEEIKRIGGAVEQLPGLIGPLLIGIADQGKGRSPAPSVASEAARNSARDNRPPANAFKNG